MINVKITGNNVSGSLLVAAMQLAHARSAGDQAAGVGHLRKYLMAQSARSERWSKATPLTPEVALSRSCQSTLDLTTAGQAIERSSELKERKKLLAEIIGPFLKSSLFGQEITVSSLGRKDLKIVAGQVTEVIKPVLPQEELKIGYYNHHLGSVSPITLEQYEIFMAQTGRAAPQFFTGPVNYPVVGVTYGDAVGFNQWLGRELPTQKTLETLGRQYPTFGVKIEIFERANQHFQFAEWTGTPTNRPQFALTYSMTRSINNVTNLACRYSDVGFRVGRSTIAGDGDETRGKAIWE
jgi:hypothetical protein